RPRGVPRGPDRDGGAAVAGIRDRHGLTRLLLQLAPQLGQPLLALPGQLLHRDELLLHAEQLGLQVTAQLDQVGLLRRELLLRRSSPYDTVSIRLASMPWLARYCLAAVARRFPSARLYSSEPRSSQCPLTRMRNPGLACRIATFWSSTPASPPRMIALS